MHQHPLADVRHLAYQNATDLIQSTVQDLLSNCIMSTSIVVSGILLTADQQFWMEQLAVLARANLVDGGRVEIDEDGTRDVFSASSLSEDSVELTRVVESLGVRVRTTILFETVFEQVPAITSTSKLLCGCEFEHLQLPSAVSELRTGLADMEVKNLQSGVQRQPFVFQCDALRGKAKHVSRT